MTNPDSDALAVVMDALHPLICGEDDGPDDENVECYTAAVAVVNALSSAGLLRQGPR